MAGSCWCVPQLAHENLVADSALAIIEFVNTHRVGITAKLIEMSTFVRLGTPPSLQLAIIVAGRSAGCRAGCRTGGGTTEVIR